LIALAAILFGLGLVYLWGKSGDLWLKYSARRTVPPAVLEEKKEIIWCGLDCFWLKPDGALGAAAPFTEGTLLPGVTSRNPVELKSGERVLESGEAENLKEIVSFLGDNGLPYLNLIAEDPAVKEISAEIIGGPKILFSLLVSPRPVGSVVSGLRDSAEWTKIGYIDLRVENRVYYH